MCAFEGCGNPTLTRGFCSKHYYYLWKYGDPTPKRRYGKVKDLTGQTFGKQLVVKRVGSNTNHQAIWLIRCECGNERIITGTQLRSGTKGSKSCSSCAHKKHGMIGTPEYRAWVAARSRCRDPNHKSWKDYGGRGIKFSPAWDDFMQFFADMGPRPSSKHSLDRIDVNGNYEPGNCRWATVGQQMSNRRIDQQARRIAELEEEIRRLRTH